METLDVGKVLAELQGLGVEEIGTDIIIPFHGRDVAIRMQNIPTEAELAAHLAVDGPKGYEWMQRIRVDVLARAITWIDGVDIMALHKAGQYVRDADGVMRPIQEVVRNLLLGWGQEVVQVLWKLLMVHSQRIEDRLVAALPEAAVMTEVERRYLDLVTQEVESLTEKVIRESAEAPTEQE